MARRTDSTFVAPHANRRGGEGVRLGHRWELNVVDSALLDRLDAYAGPAAGIATSVLWTATALCFTAGGKRIGPIAVNGLRIALAVVLLGITHRLLSGLWIPPGRPAQYVFLGASGVLGLSIGDQALFTAFVDIGPRLAMLVMAASPILAVFFGWIALGEVLQPISWLGIVLTIGGICWVVLERPPSTEDLIGQRRRRGRGLSLAVMAAVCQAGGLLLSKQGMGHGWLPTDQHMNPQAAALVRMVFACLGMIPILAWHALRRRNRRTPPSTAAQTAGRSWRAGLAFTLCGASVGPYLGMWMGRVATDRAPLGIAQTLCSLPPIFILPFAAWIHKEPITARAAIGALVAVGGSALLFLPPL